MKKKDPSHSIMPPSYLQFIYDELMSAFVFVRIFLLLFRCFWWHPTKFLGTYNFEGYQSQSKSIWVCNFSSIVFAFVCVLFTASIRGVLPLGPTSFTFKWQIRESESFRLEKKAKTRTWRKTSLPEPHYWVQSWLCPNLQPLPVARVVFDLSWLDLQSQWRQELAAP